jgi:hypothetical protein
MASGARFKSTANKTVNLVKGLPIRVMTWVVPGLEMHRSLRCSRICGSEGYFSDTRLDGVVFTRIYWWQGPIHEGNGMRRMIVDERATEQQRNALISIESTQPGGLIWEISAAVAPHSIEPIFAPTTFDVDRERRRATVRIPGIGRDKWLGRIHGIELSQITPAKIQDWKQSFLAAAGEFTALPYSPVPWQPIRQRRL